LLLPLSLPRRVLVAVPSLPEGHVLLVLVVAEPARLRDYSKLILTHYPGPLQNGAAYECAVRERARRTESWNINMKIRARALFPARSTLRSFVRSFVTATCARRVHAFGARDDSIKIYYRRGVFLSDTRRTEPSRSKRKGKNK